ncbi:MAG: acyltransferase [Bacteroidales bacterium]|nr:acyltransferase [Bacteroidales bacterium]
MLQLISNKIFSISNKKDFEVLAIKIFKYQSKNIPVYTEYLNELNIKPEQIKKIEQIPFLPVDFFKTHKIYNYNSKIDKTFTSSGTTGITHSKHYVTDISIYINSFNKTFNLFYGDIKDYCFLALLSSYLEREDSSLIYMVNNLIEQTGYKESGFFLNDIEELYNKLIILEKRNKKTILLGVSYALLNFAEKYKIDLFNTIVIETGGMKGKRKEITREELHKILTKSFGVSTIHSEYGMTELLSQAYSKENGIFHTPPWMKVLIRDIYDPFTFLDCGKSGGINIIDMANINSCSFIETKDIGRLHKNETFEVLGRIDNSDIRGCNLLVG